MIRRDYILRMIEEFVRMLARIRSLKKDRRWAEASEDLNAEFKQLTGEGAEAVARLSEAELLARIMRDGPTHLVRDKTLMLTTLLKEAGDVATAQDQMEEGRECYLKALHLMLGVLGHEDVFECPEYAPNVEVLRETLRETRLPLQTHALLMQHYERTGDFAKAEDELFAMLDAEPNNPEIIEFGVSFFRRLLAQNDAALAGANLPRAEVEEGLKDLQQRRK